MQIDVVTHFNASPSCQNYHSCSTSSIFNTFVGVKCRDGEVGAAFIYDSQPLSSLTNLRATNQSPTPTDVQFTMKSAATFATFLALGILVATENAPSAPALRGLRINADTTAVEDSVDESRKDHHHHHVKKVKKIAIPVPVKVPQFIPVPVSIPSPVVASSNTAVIGSSTNVASNNVVASGTNIAPGGAVTPAPTTVSRRPAATPAPTATQRSRATPAPTNFASTGPSGAQQPGAAVAVPRSGDAGIAEVPSSQGFGNNNNVFGPGLGASGAAGGFPTNNGGFGANPIGALNGGFGGGNRMPGFGGGGMSGGAGAGMGDFNRNGAGGFGQQMGFGAQGGNAFGGQGVMGNFGQTGNNGFAGGQPGFGQPGFGGAPIDGGNAFGGGNFNRRERQRRR